MTTTTVPSTDVAVVDPTLSDAGQPQAPAGARDPRIPDADLGRISTPTRLICGREDRVMKLLYAEEASRRHGWPLEVIDAGHVVFVDQRDAVVNALVRAVDGA